MGWISSWNHTITGVENTVWPPHIHNACEILLIRQGRAEMQIDDKIYSLEKDHLIIIPPYRIHSLRPMEAPYARVGFHIEPDGDLCYSLPPVLFEMLSKSPFEGIGIFAVGQTPNIHRLMEDIYGECAAERPKKIEMLSALLQQLLLEIYRLSPEKFSDTADREMEAAKQRLAKSLRDFPSVKSLADGCYLTESHFIVRFKKYTGFTPYQYRTVCQIAQARKMLLGGNIPLRQIAVECGFSDLNSFARRFRQIMKISPGEFRKLAKQGDIH